jgi:hypothetical protein
MRIELTIEQLVVDGISAADADRVRDAVASELASVLRHVDPSVFSSEAVESAGVSLPRTEGAAPRELGTAVGAALGRVVTGGVDR